jgi:hypothetical protein
VTMKRMKQTKSNMLDQVFTRLTLAMKMIDEAHLNSISVVPIGLVTGQKICTSWGEGRTELGLDQNSIHFWLSL